MLKFRKTLIVFSTALNACYGNNNPTIQQILQDAEQNKLTTPVQVQKAIGTCKTSKALFDAIEITAEFAPEAKPAALAIFLSSEKDYLDSESQKLYHLSELLADTRCLLLAGPLTIHTAPLPPQEKQYWTDKKLRCIFFKEQHTIHKRLNKQPIEYLEDEKLHTLYQSISSQINADSIDTLKSLHAGFALLNVQHVKEELVWKQEWFKKKDLDFFTERIHKLCSSVCSNFLKDLQKNPLDLPDIREGYHIHASSETFLKNFDQLVRFIYKDMAKSTPAIFHIYQQDLLESVPIFHVLSVYDNTSKTDLPNITVAKGDELYRFQHLLPQNLKLWKTSDAELCEQFCNKVSFHDSAIPYKPLFKQTIQLLASTEYGRDLIQRLLLLYDQIQIAIKQHPNWKGPKEIFTGHLTKILKNDTNVFNCLKNELRLTFDTINVIYYYTFLQDKNRGPILNLHKNTPRCFTDSVYHELGHIYSCYEYILDSLLANKQWNERQHIYRGFSEFLITFLNPLAALPGDKIFQDPTTFSGPVPKIRPTWPCPEIEQILGLVPARQNSVPFCSPAIWLRSISDLSFLPTQGKPIRFDHHGMTYISEEENSIYFDMDPTTLKSIETLLLEPLPEMPSSCMKNKPCSLNSGKLQFHSTTWKAHFVLRPAHTTPESFLSRFFYEPYAFFYNLLIKSR